MTARQLLKFLDNPEVCCLCGKPNDLSEWEREHNLLIHRFCGLECWRWYSRPIRLRWVRSKLNPSKIIMATESKTRLMFAKGTFWWDGDCMMHELDMYYIAWKFDRERWEWIYSPSGIKIIP